MTARAQLAVAATAALAALAGAACGGTGSDTRPAAGSASAEAGVFQTPPPPARYDVGRPATPAQIAAWDIDVGPDGAGLPPGSGTPARGAAVYAAKCASCHGASGEGTGTGSAAYPKLVGREPREGFPFGTDPKLAKTVGNYWPHATTLFDYVRRAMPQLAPGTLTAEETYALVAFLLAENGIVGRDAVMDARTLPAVRMPARDRFVRDDRAPGAAFR